MMKLLDLFSGIGGFSLAAEWTGKIKTVAFCEIDKYCQKVLNKNYPEVKIYDDIKLLTREKLEEDDIHGIDIISGGFPCQPYSIAGKQRGAADDRALWKEMFRLIAKIRPQWIVGENVDNIINLGIENCLSELENENYKTEVYSIPAYAVKAPHKRQRIFIVAHEQGEGVFETTRSAFANISGEHGEKHISGNKLSKTCGNGTFGRSFYAPDWSEDWTEAASRLCRVDDGLSTRMDRHRIAMLGNSIVPQIAFRIFEAILKYEKERTR